MKSAKSRVESVCTVGSRAVYPARVLLLFRTEGRLIDRRFWLLVVASLPDRPRLLLSEEPMEGDFMLASSSCLLCSRLPIFGDEPPERLPDSFEKADTSIEPLREGGADCSLLAGDIMMRDV